LSTQAQTFTVIHAFTGGGDGGQPNAGLTMDEAGNLYGTTSAGGSLGTCQADPSQQGCGTVFKLAHMNSEWVLSALYTFHGGGDGAGPLARVIFGPNGTLYGTTLIGGDAFCNSVLFFGYGCGIVFNLRPPTHICMSVSCPWTETVLHSFPGGTTDGAHPVYGDLIFDLAGNLYGTTFDSGTLGGGIVFELMPSDGGWAESVLYNFLGGGNLANLPASGVIFDQAGNIYGAAQFGGGCDGFGGVVYELTPSSRGWQENDLHYFSCGSDGGAPIGGLIFDQSGNLYGTDTDWGAGNGGTAFTLSPSSGGWVFALDYSFEYSFGGNGGYSATFFDPARQGTHHTHIHQLFVYDGGTGPFGSLSMDAAGNLYGTAYQDGAYGGCDGGCGAVFKLTPSGSGWTYASLHDFTGGSDGAHPFGNMIFDSDGNLYGTASGGGNSNSGVVWEITP